MHKKIAALNIETFTEKYKKALSPLSFDRQTKQGLFHSF